MGRCGWLLQPAPSDATNGPSIGGGSVVTAANLPPGARNWLAACPSTTIVLAGWWANDDAVLKTCDLDKGEVVASVQLACDLTITLLATTKLCLHQQGDDNELAVRRMPGLELIRVQAPHVSAFALDGAFVVYATVGTVLKARLDDGQVVASVVVGSPVPTAVITRTRGEYMISYERLVFLDRAALAITRSEHQPYHIFASAACDRFRVDLFTTGGVADVWYQLTGPGVATRRVRAPNRWDVEVLSAQTFMLFGRDDGLVCDVDGGHIAVPFRPVLALNGAMLAQRGDELVLVHPAKMLRRPMLVRSFEKEEQEKERRRLTSSGVPVEVILI